MTPLLAALLLAAQSGAYQRGVQAFEQGRHQEAIALLSEAVRQAPRDAQAWKVLGVVHAARSDYREAEPPFARACELNPRLTDACYYHGRALYMLNRFEDALAPLERALRVDAVRGRAETAIAESLEALGRALDLPDYYGVNWDALEECLGDFSWRSGPIRLFLHHADAIPTGLLDTLIAVFSEAAAEWSRQGRVCSLFLADTGRRELPEAG